MILSVAKNNELAQEINVDDAISGIALNLKSIYEELNQLAALMSFVGETLQAADLSYAAKELEEAFKQTCLNEIDI